MAQNVTHTIITSIGNPEPYLNTLHSAGHIALECLRREMDLPPFKLQRPFYLRTSTLSTGNDRYTLLRSPMRMNESGRWLEQVWRGATLFHKDYDGLPGLVLLHDMLNMPIGQLKLRRWESRPRGHNGLKSIEAYMPREEFPTASLSKVAVGIGTPPSWVNEKLVRFLLQPLNREQETGLSSLGPLIVQKIKQAEKQWTEEGLLSPNKFWRKGLRWEEGSYHRGRG